MLNERKLTENELEQRKIALKGLLKNKRALVKKYGADAEKVMYGIATKQAKKKIEKMNLENLRSMIKDALTQPVKEQSPFVLAADAARDAGKKEFEFPKGSGKMHPVTIKTDIKEDIKDFEVDNAIGELGDIIRDIDEKADEARNIIRDIFPNELSRLDAYGVFNMTYSNNRYDTTLGKFVERLEEEGYEIEDGQVYVNEGDMMSMDDLDVGHIDDEPGMLKSELARAGKMIQMLYRAIDKYDGKGEVDFPQWWQKKIIQANAMLDSAFDYLDGKESVAKIDAMIDTIDEERAADKDNVNVFGYQTKYYKVCPGAQEFMRKVVNGGYGDMSEKKEEIIRVAKLHDLLFMRKLKALKDPNYAKKITTSGEVEYIADEIKDMVENLGISKADVGYIDMHVEDIFKAVGRIDEEKIEVDADTEFVLPLKHLIKKHVKEIVGEKKLTAAEKNKKEDIIKGIAKQKGGKKKLEPVDYAVATDRAKKLAEKNDQ